MRRLHEVADPLGRVLAVGIHDERVREARREGLERAGEDRGALAPVARPSPLA